MDEAGFAIDRKDLIEGLGKGLRIIEAFDDDHSRLTPSEAAERAGITRTAARRYLLSLCHFGYAATDGKLFWLMPRVLRLGQSYLGAARLPRLVQPFIQRLSMACGETVNMSVLDGHEVVYVARIPLARRDHVDAVRIHHDILGCREKRHQQRDAAKHIGFLGRGAKAHDTDDNRQAHLEYQNPSAAPPQERRQITVE